MRRHLVWRRWRSTGVAGPGLPASASVGWTASSTTSADAEWTAIKAAWGGCAYCGATDKPLQRDCVLPISRGGRYTLDNIAPACPACNASKCNDEVTGWLRRKRLDERAFLVRHHEITAPLTAPVPPRARSSDDRHRHVSGMIKRSFIPGSSPGPRKAGDPAAADCGRRSPSRRCSSPAWRAWWCWARRPRCCCSPTPCSAASRSRCTGPTRTPHGEATGVRRRPTCTPSPCWVAGRARWSRGRSSGTRPPSSRSAASSGARSSPTARRSRGSCTPPLRCRG